MLQHSHLRLLDRLHGEAVRWFRALGRCPCYDPATGAWNRDHATCAGTGVLRVEQDVDAYRAIVTEVRLGRQLQQRVGQLEVGQLSLSVWPGEIDPGEQDHFIIPSREAVETELLTRGAGASDTLKHAEASEILVVHDADQVIASGYSLGDGAITWSANAPAAGERYAVAYRYQPRWQVVQGSILYRKPDADGTKLPVHLQLRLWTPSDTD